MEIVNVPEQLQKLIDEKKSGTTNLIAGDTFSFDVRVENGTYKPRLHICSQDELTYVLSGEVDMVVEGESHILHAGDCILVKSGKKHKTVSRPGAAWILISKPHKHAYFE